MKWLFLRGLAREQLHWGQFPSQFAKGLESEVFCLDLPGMGDQAHRVSPVAITDITEDVRQRWLSLHEKTKTEPWGLLAISLGGMVALDWVARYPLDFQQVVLLNSSVSNLSSAFRRMQPQALLRILKVFASPMPHQREKAILDLTSNLRGQDQNLVQQWTQIAVERPMKRGNVVRQLLAASRFKSPPPPLMLPLLVLTSAQDRLVHTSCSQQIAAYYQAPILTHSLGGHDLPLDAPEWVIEQVQRNLVSR